MPKLLVIVHSSQDAGILTAFFKKKVPNLELTCLPMPEKDKCFEKSNNFVFSQNLPDEADVVIVESNYGIPADSRANSALITQLLKKYPQSIIVARSSTLDSLTAALGLDARITILGKGDITPEGCDKTRVHSITTLKDHLMTNVENEDEKTKTLTFAYDLSIALSECMTSDLDDETKRSHQYKTPTRPS